MFSGRKTFANALKFRVLTTLSLAVDPKNKNSFRFCETVGKKLRGETSIHERFENKLQINHKTTSRD